MHEQVRLSGKGAVIFEVTKDIDDEQARKILGDEEAMKDGTGKDGSLPGCLSPELVKALTCDR